MMFCQSCGENLQEDAKFCQKCGTSVSIATDNNDPAPTKEISKNEKNAIWNPNAASIWSLIFTPAFGSYLHALNWRTLGEKDRANSAMGWFYFSLVMLVVYIFMGMFMADEKAADGAASGLGFLYLLIWYFSAGKSQAKYIKEKFGKDYLHRGWGKPLLIGVAASIGYLFIAVVMVFTLGMMHSSTMERSALRFVLEQGFKSDCEEDSICVKKTEKYIGKCLTDCDLDILINTPNSEYDDKAMELVIKTINCIESQ